MLKRSIIKYFPVGLIAMHLPKAAAHERPPGVVMVPDLDARLGQRGVRFLPWLGPDYELGFRGRRVLILGDSHYADWGDGRSHLDEMDAFFTRSCVTKAINREVGSPLWQYLEQAMLNEERVDQWAPNGRQLWRQIAFYNFVQFPVASSYSKPTDEQFRSSAAPFLALLEELQPERVIVCGRVRLWEGMPPTPADLFLHRDIQGYRLKMGEPTWCLAIQHPSRGLSWRQWHPIIMAFLDDPTSATRLAMPV